jgi:hypothetical protein
MPSVSGTSPDHSPQAESSAGWGAKVLDLDNQDKVAAAVAILLKGRNPA